MATARTTPGPGQPRGRRGLRILLVEDQADVGASLALLLRLQGHQVEWARDGHAALEAAHALAPDVVGLDIGLPRMDGWQLARSLRGRADGGQPLLVAVTSYGREEDRRRSAEAGIDHHLVKPVEPEQLLRLL